ncbi:MAG: DUF3160 domain-containing protein [Sedimentisphaerales bacterium]|nr:DUF3160 domain-containing protein [Sedimentisphaerales bacterium]
MKNLELIAILLALLMSIQSQGEQETDQNWRKLAQKENLSESVIEKLSENNVVITETAYKQIFTPYIESNMTFFITTDSLINAYHVLYEESILRLEKANASRLEEILKFVLSNLSKNNEDINYRSDLVTAAQERAFIVVGTAIKLLDENFKLDDNKINRIINEEVEKIELAEANEKPLWLGEPTNDLYSIDYSRYKPRGFYIESELLSKYFRAVSWLQSIPFRLSQNDELLSILILGNCLDLNKFDGDSEKYQRYTDFFSAYKMFIGTGDDWNVITAKEQINGKLNKNDLSNIRKKLKQKLKAEGGSLINDQVRFPPLNSNTAAAEPQFRFISAYRTPDAVMFHRTTDLREFSRPFPTGLEVCAALGSEFAKSKLEYSDKAKLLKTIEDTKEAFSGNSLYLDYLQCLACLLDEPPAESPAFMKNETWQAKSCNTTLAGWSQLRHTWSLQAKQSVTYMGMVMPPTGFVEPEPEFYNKMVQLAQKTKELLGKSGALETNYKQMSDDIMYFAELVEKNNFKISVTDLPRNEWERFDLVSGLLFRLQVIDGQSDRRDYSKKNIDDLRQIARDLLVNKLPEDIDLMRRIRDYDYNLKELWNSLESMSRTLAEIAQKQLDGEDLAQYERFFKSYGINLAKIMFYNQNSYEGPIDDAMRIVDVHYSPGDGYLEVGITRPRAIYVLYPWQGTHILCRGAVMPYYEFISDSRLTDTEWKERLNSEQKPDVPNWIKSVISDGSLPLPSFIREANAKTDNERLILEAAAIQLNKKPDELTEDDYDQITELRLSGPKLIEIRRMSRFRNLHKLQINGGNFDSIDGLINLRNLEYLEITNNKISNISLLSRLWNLQTLNLSGTQVNDINPLANLSSLNTLNLNRTQVNNIESLVKLKNLKILDISGTKVSKEQIAELKNILPNLKILSD